MMASMRFSKQHMLDFWVSRSPREQLLLSLWGGFILIAMVVGTAIFPAVDGIRALASAQHRHEQTAMGVAALASEARALRQLPQAGLANPSELVGALDKSAHTLQAEQPMVLPNGDIKLVFHAVNYGTWLQWLAQTEHGLGVRTIQANIRKTVPDSSSATVDVDLVLRGTMPAR
jgi:type II secretory pathway component PulM